MRDTVERIKKLMGEPRNYGPTPEELEEMKRLEEEAKLRMEAEERAERERKESDEAAERKRRQEEWVRGERAISYINTDNMRLPIGTIWRLQ